jgi:hypothetical protein
MKGLSLPDQPRGCLNAADQQLALVVDLDQWTTTVGAGVGLVSSQAGQFISAPS